MKRFHLHLHVNDLDASVAFYNRLFARPADVIKADYAKWLIESPPLNFAITRAATGAGVGHVGLQLDSDEQLQELRSRMDEEGIATRDQTDANCCYARSNKAWIEDPDGLRWEAFMTHGAIESFGDDTLSKGQSAVEPQPQQKACCAA